MSDQVNDVALVLRRLRTRIRISQISIESTKLEIAAMSQEMDRLEIEVREMTVAVDAAIAAFNGVAEQIRDAAGDRAKSIALANDLDAKARSLAEAIPANTP